MSIFTSCVLFAAGIILVIKGGGWFVDAASAIARAMNIPTFIIGATIVSLATTMPEMLVSFIAAAGGKVDMAVGNAVGSVTANTALIMAIGMIAMSIVCGRGQYLRQLLLWIAASSVLLISCLSGRLSIPGSAVLAVIFILFMVQNVLSARQGSSASQEAKTKDKKNLGKYAFFFLVGAGAIVGGSRLMVTCGSEIAAFLGVPERIVAVTLIAVGTSLPELVTTITAIARKESALSIGNIIGANIIDLSLILPVCSLISGQALPVAAQSISIDLPACLIVTLMAAVPLLLRQRSSKYQGIALLSAYALYLILVI